MSVRGVPQLKRLQLYFCEHGGSSKGMRNYLMSPQLQQFRGNFPHIEFEFIKRNFHPPMVYGTYINGYTKKFVAKNEQPEDIEENINRFRTSFGTQKREFKGPGVYSSIKSVQGQWRANLWNTYPKHELEVIRELPEIKFIPQQRKVLKEYKDRALPEKDSYKIKGDWESVEKSIQDQKNLA